MNINIIKKLIEFMNINIIKKLIEFYEYKHN